MKLSNNNILKEWYKEPVERKKVMIYPSIIYSHEASEIAEQEGLEKEWMGAKAWFEGVVESREEFELEEMPKYCNFVCHMDYIEADLYYSFEADYYFAVLNKLKTENMKKNKIRLTESKLKQIVAESVKKVLKEGTGRCPDKYFGGYFFEGLGLDGNGNPIYCSEHLPLEAKKMLGWRKSAKYGMRGQADDWVVCHVLDELGLPRGNDEEGYFE